MGLKINELIKKINSEAKKNLVSEGISDMERKRIPFSDPMLNYMTYGGVPIGLSTEIVGRENAGKSALTYDLIGNAQKYAKKEYEDKLAAMEMELQRLENSGKEKKKLKEKKEEYDALLESGVRKVLLMDLEGTFDKKYAENTFNIDTSSLICFPTKEVTTPSAEQLAQACLDFIDTGEILMVVLDSSPKMIPEKQAEETMDKKSYCGNSAILTTFANKLDMRLNRYKVAFVSTNQIRTDMSNPFEKFHTPGGFGWKHFFSLRLALIKGTPYNSSYKDIAQKEETEYGHAVTAVLVKTKMCKPDRKRVTFHYTIGEDKEKVIGLDVFYDTILLAKSLGYIAQAGAWFNIMDDDKADTLMLDGSPCKAQGMPKLIEFLRNTPQIFEYLNSKIDDICYPAKEEITYGGEVTFSNKDLEEIQKLSEKEKELLPHQEEYLSEEEMSACLD